MNSQIAAAFESGTLLRPSALAPDLVHLTRALASLAGSRNFDRDDPPVRKLLELIGPAEHLIFVLLDGLGMNLIRKMPSDSFMVRHLKAPIRATCPSTTACALTSVATGAWPAQHGVTGWFTHVPDRGFTMTTLPMVERFSGEPLAARGITTSDVLPLAAYHAQMTHRPLTLLPSPIVDTLYARYSRGGTAGSPYTSIQDAVDQAATYVRDVAQPSYTHWYVPDVDSACHHDGLEAKGVLELLLKLDGELTRLRALLPATAKIVISADHGLLDVPVDAHMTLFANDPLMEMLQVPPSGDARLPIFHVRPGLHSEFEPAFNARFGEGMSLLASHEAEELGLFGPGRMSEAARLRFGDFVGIALRPVSLHYALPPAVPVPADTKAHGVYVAQHAGLSRDEMEIPLLVA